MQFDNVLDNVDSSLSNDQVVRRVFELLTDRVVLDRPPERDDAPPPPGARKRRHAMCARLRRHRAAFLAHLASAHPDRAFLRLSAPVLSALYNEFTGTEQSTNSVCRTLRLSTLDGVSRCRVHQHDEYSIEYLLELDVLRR